MTLILSILQDVLYTDTRGGMHLVAKAIVIRVLMYVGFSFCLITLCLTLRSNFLSNRINFIHGHKLLPCLQQRLLQVYRKMFIPITDDNVDENFILYDIIFLFV